MGALHQADSGAVIHLSSLSSLKRSHRYLWPAVCHVPYQRGGVVIQQSWGLAEQQLVGSYGDHLGLESEGHDHEQEGQKMTEVPGDQPEAIQYSEACT